MNILLIDNYDSFTYILRDYLLQAGATACTTIRNDTHTIAQIRQLNFDAIVISPGPKRPEDAGISLKVIAVFHRYIPILGICLGHQAIGMYLGATVRKSTVPVHGKTSTIYHNGHSLFEGLPSQFSVMRYHSLIIDDLENTDIVPIAHTQDGICMAAVHQTWPLTGLQFHPESILTEYGLEMLGNWMNGL